MKTKPISYLVAFAAIATSVFINCSGKKEEATHEHETPATETPAVQAAAAPQFTVDAAFQKQLADVFTSYVTLKEAFVATDASKVKTEATNTQQVLAKVDMMLLSGPAHNDWMIYLGGIESSLKEITSATDIEVQRKAFSTLSDNLYKTIKAYGLGGTTAYYEFCPMAFNDQGGFWLSDNEKIRNPYFGDKMLTCGSVKETLQ
jgi:Protein of unknown function (DUF3347)